MKVAILWILLGSLAFANPPVVHDGKLKKKFMDGVGALADTGNYPKASELAESLKKAPESVEIDKSAYGKPSDDPLKAVYMIGGVYKCGKCEKWHSSGAATAWALTASGIMVTNHHVMAGGRGDVLAVMDQDGNCYAVTEVLAASEDSDFAIIRVDGVGLAPLALSEPAAIGTKVTVISHPRGRYFTHTFGHISRYYYNVRKKGAKEVPFMGITADYAKGSSGGPVIDPEGRVVGMVSSTTSLYTERGSSKEPKGMLQMVTKNCVPVVAIRKGLGLDSK